MKVNIRSEQVKDYAQIAEINNLAFTGMALTGILGEANRLGNVGKAEMLLVDVLRHAPDFDPDLALVAEVDGRVVGHALFYPYRAFIQGEEVAAVGLHPIATHPDFQKQGIGGALMVEGHRRCQEKGYVFAFLYGHPDYYPRFGYQTHVFGRCGVEVERQNIPISAGQLEERQLEPGDVAQIIALWQTWFMDAPLAVFPGRSFLDWVTHFDPFETTALLSKGELKGFLRLHPNDPAKIKSFLAKDTAATAQLLAHLHQKYSQHPTPTLFLPIHPATKAARWLPCPYTAKVETWDAGMIKIFNETHQPIRAYCAEVRAGRRQAGLALYPPYIDGAE